jgi:hypothetical protein
MKFNKRVFIATLHGKEGSKDLIEEYIKFLVKKVSQEIGDRDEQKKRLCHVFGYKDRTGKWVPGINPSTNYVCYMWDWSDSTKPLYRLEFYKKQMDRIEELYLSHDTSDEPLTVDPFSSADGGIGIVFDKYKDEKGKWDFRIDDERFNPKKFKTYTEFQESFALKDGQLAQLAEVKPLKELFGRGSFKASDFKIQLSGLVLFDEKHEYGLFNDDEFLNVVENIAEQYEGTAEEEEKEIKQQGKDIDKVFKDDKKKVTPKVSMPKNSKVVVKEEEPEDENDSFKEEQEVEQEQSANESEEKSGNMNDSLQKRLDMLRKKRG